VAGFRRMMEAYRAGRFVFRHAGGQSGLVRSASVPARDVWPRKDLPSTRALGLLSGSGYGALPASDASYPGQTSNVAILGNLKPCVMFAHQLSATRCAPAIRQAGCVQAHNRCLLPAARRPKAARSHEGVVSVIKRVGSGKKLPTWQLVPLHSDFASFKSIL
jgi:hypothetical protein